MIAGPGLPLFLDRSVGTKRVAARLRALGLTVPTIDDRYGTGAAPSVDDPTWITEAARDGYVLLGADLRNPLPDRRAVGAVSGERAIPGLSSRRLDCSADGRARRAAPSLDPPGPRRTRAVGAAPHAG